MEQLQKQGNYDGLEKRFKNKAQEEAELMHSQPLNEGKEDELSFTAVASGINELVSHPRLKANKHYNTISRDNMEKTRALLLKSKQSESKKQEGDSPCDFQTDNPDVQAQNSTKDGRAPSYRPTLLPSTTNPHALRYMITQKSRTKDDTEDVTWLQS